MWLRQLNASQILFVVWPIRIGVDFRNGEIKLKLSDLDSTVPLKLRFGCKSFACSSSSENCNGLLNFHSCMLELVYIMEWSQSAQYRRPNMSTQVVRSGIKCWTLIWSYWTYQELPSFVSACALSQRDKPKNTRYMEFILATCIFVFDFCLLCSKHTRVFYWLSVRTWCGRHKFDPRHGMH